MESTDDGLLVQLSTTPLNPQAGYVYEWVGSSPPWADIGG